MPSLNVCILAHYHLPLGVSEGEKEALYTEQLKPLMMTLAKTLHIQMLLHISGPLLHWIETAHPEFLLLLDDLLHAKQIEFLGGGFYEPYLSFLPLVDKIGQIEMFTTYLRKQFGKRPQGIWLPDFDWEPSLPGALNSCGVGFTFLPERLFTDKTRPCLAEDQGKMLTVFPVWESLSNEGEGLAAELRRLSEEITHEDAWISLMLDGRQSTGLIFSQLLSAVPYVNFCTPGRSYKALQRLPRQYFAAASTKNILIEHPEANALYSKTLYTGLLINQLRGDKARKKNAREELWKAQCSDAYREKDTCCAAETGGIYRPEIRAASYQALLKAEKTARERGVFTASVQSFDFDMDGENEHLLQNDSINTYIGTYGGAVFEFDVLPCSFNYCDTIAAPRLFSDYFYSERERRDCGRENYSPFESVKKGQKLRIGFRLPRKAGDAGLGSLQVEKIYSLKKESLSVFYTIKNEGNEMLDFKFSPRICQSFPSDKPMNLRIYTVKADKKYLYNSAEGPAEESLQELNAIVAQDIKNELILTLYSKKLFSVSFDKLYCKPPHLELEPFYSASLALPCFHLSLNPGESWENELVLHIAN
jgi:hypothetical protein